MSRTFKDRRFTYDPEIVEKTREVVLRAIVPASNQPRVEELCVIGEEFGYLVEMREVFGYRVLARRDEHGEELVERTFAPHEVQENFLYLDEANVALLNQPEYNTDNLLFTGSLFHDFSEEFYKVASKEDVLKTVLI